MAIGTMAERIIMSAYQINLYKDSDYSDWDTFVLENSANGTFLQSRRFLSYHPEERFQDYSLIVKDEKDHIVSVIPGCVIYDNGKKVFSSHKGSTFGGPVIAKKHYNLQKSTEIIEAVEEYLKAEGFGIIEYKTTPSVFSKERSDLLEYVFYYEKYTSYAAMSLAVDYAHYNDNVYSNLSQGKRTDVNNCKKAGMTCRKIDTAEEIACMYDILCETLEKYDAKPVHSVEELLDFKDNRLKDNVGFFGIFLDDEMVAGSMMFYFENNVAHTQYLCAKSEYNKLSPMSFLYYCMLEEMKAMGFNMLSWGGTTEENGTVINMGLARSKEAYGSTYYNNYTYVKEL